MQRSGASPATIAGISVAGGPSPTQILLQPRSASTSSASDKPSVCRWPGAVVRRARRALRLRGRSVAQAAAARRRASVAMCSSKIEQSPACQSSPNSTMTCATSSATCAQLPPRVRASRSNRATSSVLPDKIPSSHAVKRCLSVPERTDASRFLISPTGIRRCPPPVLWANIEPSSTQRWMVIGATPSRRAASPTVTTPADIGGLSAGIAARNRMCEICI